MTGVPIRGGPMPAYGGVPPAGAARVPTTAEAGVLERLVGRVEPLLYLYVIALSSGALGFVDILVTGDAYVRQDTSLFARLQWPVIYLAFGALAWIHGRAVAAAALSAWPILLWPALAWLSVVWSMDPATTLGQALRFSVTILIGVLMGARLSVPRLVAMVFFVTLAGVGLSVLLSLAGVGFALAPGGDARGIYFHKNMLGGQAVLLFALSAVLLLRGRLVPFALVGCIAAMLGTMLSDSATAAAVTGLLIVGLPLLAALAMRPLAAATMVFTALLFACVIALLFVHFGTDPYTEALRLLDRDPTLTGRWDLWDAALAQIGDRPVLGYGFAAFWTAGADWRTEAVLAELGDVGHFHNTFLEVAVQLGLLGVALTALVLLLAAATWMRELVRRRDVILAWPPALWVLLMIAGLAEVVLVVKHALFQILFVAVFVQIVLLRGWRPVPGGDGR